MGDCDAISLRAVRRDMREVDTFDVQLTRTDSLNDGLHICQFLAQRLISPTKGQLNKYIYTKGQQRASIDFLFLSISLSSASCGQNSVFPFFPFLFELLTPEELAAPVPAPPPAPETDIGAKCWPSFLFKNSVAKLDTLHMHFRYRCT